MRQVTKVNLPRRFWLSAIVALAWVALPSGIYHLAAGSQKWGIVLLALGVILLLILVLPGTLGRLERRPILSAQGAVFVLFLAIFSLLQLWMAVTAPPRNDWRDAFTLIDALGFVALTGLTCFLFVRSVRLAQTSGPLPPPEPRRR
jgi:hypothetical protein